MMRGACLSLLAGVPPPARRIVFMKGTQMGASLSIDTMCDE
jgi:hypothetical protein